MGTVGQTRDRDICSEAGDKTIRQDGERSTQKGDMLINAVRHVK